MPDIKTSRPLFSAHQLHHIQPLQPIQPQPHPPLQIEPVPMSQRMTTVASAPPKRSKASHIVLKTRRVQPITRNPDGNPKLPQQIGVLTVVSLGKIRSDLDTFHNERYIFPVGYTVRR